MDTSVVLVELDFASKMEVDFRGAFLELWESIHGYEPHDGVGRSRSHRGQSGDWFCEAKRSGHHGR
jgi:hypothetical protein